MRNCVAKDHFDLKENDEHQHFFFEGLTLNFCLGDGDPGVFHVVDCSFVSDSYNLSKFHQFYYAPKKFITFSLKMFHLSPTTLISLLLLILKQHFRNPSSINLPHIKFIV